jgi:hypothetical protein
MAPTKGSSKSSKGKKLHGDKFDLSLFKNVDPGDLLQAIAAIQESRAERTSKGV